MRHRLPHRGSTRGLLPVLLIAQLMVIVDISAVNVALPDMARDLRLPAGSIGWTITSYSLLFGSLLLLGGRAADLLGRRRVFFSGLAVFVAASLASALAGSASGLFAARAGQGLGAAMLSPAALSILTGAFKGEARVRALGAWGAVGGAGAAVGVLLGGALTQVADWRAIFFINLPVAVVLAVVGRHVVPADGDAPRWSGLDVRGAVVATGSLAAVVYALSRAESAGWTSAVTLSLGVAGLAGLAVFVVLERRSPLPLLRVQRLGDRAVGGGFALMLVASAVIFGAFLLTSLYLQTVLGMGPLATGLAFLPFAVSVGMGAHMGSHLVARAGVRAPVTAAFAIVAAGMFLLSGVRTGGGYFEDVLPGLIVSAVGLGIVLASVVISLFSTASEEETGMLSGLNTTGHEVGGTLGIAVLVTIASTAAGGGAIGSVGAVGIGRAFLAAGALALFGSPVALVVLPAARSFLPRMRLAPSSMPLH
jgi:EmrB/QacA subfamily drug resistance transporter